MSDVRILWSGLTGRTGREAMEQVKEMSGIKIVAGISRFDYDGAALRIEEMQSDADGLHPSREHDFGEVKKWYLYQDIANPLKGVPEDFDAMVDFSNIEVFDQVVECAVRARKPLICGTFGLSDRQIASLYDATNHIPVFRGGNFRFKVKKFIDEAVELAIREEGRLDLYEEFYKGKSLPSEISRVLQRRIMETTGRTVEVHSADDYGYMNLICNWEFQVHREESPTNTFQEKVHCRTIGFDELAHDVLEIAKVMAKKPVKKGEFYDLDEIWDDIPTEAKAPREQRRVV